MKKFLFLALILIPFLLVSCPDQNGREIDVAPRIVLIGPSEVFFNVNDTYVEYGYIATDVDGNDVSSLVRRDISSLNMGKEGSYQVSYVAVDRKGVKSDPLFRTVNVGDAFAPQISISGANPLLIPLNSDFSPPSASAFAYDGSDLSDSISIDASSVDTSSVGTYLVSYSVSDSSGVFASASLFVYVLESSNPRIIVPEKGVSAENPFLIQTLGPDSQEDVKKYFLSQLPLIQAFDLEDGDISYKVTIDENSWTTSGIAEALKNNAPDTTAYELLLSVSDSEGNTPVPLPSFFVSVVTDTTPPVIAIAKEGPYQIEVDMWRDNSADWSKLLSTLGVTVWDDSWGSAQSPYPFDPDDIPLGDDSDPILSSLSIDDAALKTVLTHATGADLSLYDYNNANAEVNMKTVTFKATDNSGNEASAAITVQMVDTTPAEIIVSSPEIAFGAASIGTEKQLRYRDNSGQEGYCSGLTLGKIANALVQGSFSVEFTAPLLAPNATAADNVKAQTKTVAVRVGSPLNNASGGADYMRNNLLNADFDGNDITANVWEPSIYKMDAFSPSKWGFSGNNNYWTYYSGGSAKKSDNISSWPVMDRQHLIIGGVGYPKTNPKITALLFAGCRYVDTNTWVNHQNFTAALHSANGSVSLYEGVEYSFGYDSIVYQTTGDNMTDETKREIVFSVAGGSGKFDDSTSISDSFLSRTNLASISGTASGATDDQTKMYELLQSHPSVNESQTYRSQWQINNDITATIKGGNVTAVNVTFSVAGPQGMGGGFLGMGDKYYDDAGGFLTNVRIIPVKWPGKKELNNPDSQQGFYTYNLSNGSVAWSEG